MKVKCAAIQLQSQDDLSINLERTAALLAYAAKHAVKLVVLPENFAMFAAGAQLQTAKQLPQIQAWLSAQARQHDMWIIAGSIPCAERKNGETVPNNKVRASCFVYNNQGVLAGRYDKIHLFDVSIGDAQGQYQESATFEAGDEIVLLQARAIETQCFIIGAGQSGVHSPVRTTWGHSQLIDAWGTVLAEQQQQGEGVVIAECDLAEQQRIRQQIPLLSHRRLC
jgi:predicted amidohydrolase